MSVSEDPSSTGPAKRANPWLEFQARVRGLTDLSSKETRELCSFLRSKKPYGEWSDKEIISSAITWVKNAPLFDACYNGDLATVKALVSSGADITVEDKDGYDLIDYTIMGGDYVELVTWLLNNGLQELIDIHQMLGYACQEGRVEIGKLAIQRGANISINISNAKQTALHIAAYKGHAEIVSVLISSGAVINIQDRNGYTPMDWAITMFNNLNASSTRGDIVRLLHAAGAKTNKKTLPSELNLEVDLRAVWESAKAEEARVRAEEEAKIAESTGKVRVLEARVAELRTTLAQEEAALAAAKEAAGLIAETAAAAIEKASGCTVAAAAAVTASSQQTAPLPPANDITPNTIQHEPATPVTTTKRKIPKHIKTLVWNKYVGADTVRNKCFSCREAMISITAFECGHIVAEAKGGDITINNLRPICRDCNLAMGIRNMNDFTSEFFGWTV